MLYTRAGDKGTTKTFACDQRISKSSAVAEALGSLDEVNSFLGLCKVRSEALSYKLKAVSFPKIVHGIQQNLFIVQAELAGSPKKIEKKKVKEVEAFVDAAEKELPPIKTFFISGGTELASFFDVSRTLARRAERRVVAVSESFNMPLDKEGKQKIGPETLAYLNRLSSLLYALARLSNHFGGIKEQPPNYK
ncbi:MAG: cob(I)yrinic acid a,c-diamide adenosyltransferase [Patescibacteria group bacterium]